MDSEVQPRLSVESQGGEKSTTAEDETTPFSLRLGVAKAELAELEVEYQFRTFRTRQHMSSFESRKDVFFEKLENWVQAKPVAKKHTR
jgi:hypothetical protein